jgi:hypothetical protein
MINRKAEFIDSGGRFFTIGLFLETDWDIERARFTFDEIDKEYKGKTFLSLKRLYMETDDVTEYKFAMLHLGGWNHWQKMCNNSSLREHIEGWREELAIRKESEGIFGIEKLAKEGNYAASKYLADKGWATGKGRPTKAEKAGALKGSKIDKEEHDKDTSRVLSIVKGGK